MQIKLNISGWSTAIVPDQDYADAVCTPSRCPFFYENECWIYNMGEHPERRSVGYPPPYGCEAVESYDVTGRMGEYTVAAPDPGDVTKIGTARETIK